jgi:hypothetical protein
MSAWNLSRLDGAAVATTVIGAMTGVQWVVEVGIGLMILSLCMRMWL